MKQTKLNFIFITILLRCSINDSVYPRTTLFENVDRTFKIAFLRESLSQAICEQTKNFANDKTHRLQEVLMNPSKFPQFSKSKACNKLLWRDCKHSVENGMECEKFSKRSCNVIQNRKSSSKKPECVSVKPSNEELKPNATSFWWYEEKTRCYYNISLIPEPRPRFLIRKARETKFFLFTLKNPRGNGEELKANVEETLQKSGYIANATLKIICHGFLSSSKADSSTIIRDAYFAQGHNYNVILVDWSSMAETLNYCGAAADVKLVGEATRVLVLWLIKHKLVTLKQIHFIGFSLGAHVGGHFGFLMKSSKKLVGRITGLEPAGPLFTDKPNSDRLDSSDAHFVDIIHTNTKILGLTTPLGHADFYPNSGSSQPLCGFFEDIVGTCSHSASYKYFAESIAGPKKFQSCKSPTWEIFLDGVCEAINFMGEHVKFSVNGNFFLRTNRNSDYSIT